MESDDAGVVLAVGVAPGHALVFVLLGDLGVPLVSLTAEARDPVNVAIVALLDPVDALHEVRKLLELGPLVVGLTNRDVDLD